MVRKVLPVLLHKHALSEGNLTALEFTYHPDRMSCAEGLGDDPVKLSGM